MGESYKIENLRIEGKFISFRINQIDYRFDLTKISPRLANASDEERSKYRVSPSGYGIHWESIDEDLSIKGLIE